jgi:hypothetical protein
MNSHQELLNTKRAEQVAQESDAFHQLMKLLDKKLTANEEELAIRLWVNGTLASEWVGWYDRAIIDKGYDRAEKVAN